MPDQWTRVSLDEIEPNPDKPGKRWVLSPELGIDEFNFNVAVLENGDRLSQSHFHYHENQNEMFFVIAGRCRAETVDDGLELNENEAIAFPAGPDGAHVIHNPYDEPCKVVAIGWPADGRFPVESLETTEELLERRYGER